MHLNVVVAATPCQTCILASMSTLTVKHGEYIKLDLYLMHRVGGQMRGPTVDSALFVICDQVIFLLLIYSSKLQQGWFSYIFISEIELSLFSLTTISTGTENLLAKPNVIGILTNTTYHQAATTLGVDQREKHYIRLYHEASSPFKNIKLVSSDYRLLHRQCSA